MKKLRVVLTVCLVLLCVCSCEQDDFQRFGKFSMRFSSNVIGAKKGYEKETKALESAAETLLEAIASTSTGGESKIPTSRSDIEAIVSSINTFSGRKPLDEKTTITDGFELKYEKTIDLSEVSIPHEQQGQVAEPMLQALKGNTDNPKQDTDSVLGVIEKGRERIEQFRTYSQSKNEEMKQIAAIAIQCINGCQTAVEKAIEHATSPTDLNLEDVVVTSLANVVKTEYGRYATDPQYNYDDIVSEMTGALDYLNTLMNMGIIPRFDMAHFVDEVMMKKDN